ncbi:hypothetical protein GIS00_12060 [Nakamurella sp. YIM 132087]|uniref:Uncharacterized protein n=1 Tax=Nakamurella alba TaxID=2665158 RepID=A0A7K1FKK6_9ACTN|nr:hypothetical protein [Nakamurella alba]MTD14677.1 hypothetical protein [Nakamurella alba]
MRLIGWRRPPHSRQDARAELAWVALIGVVTSGAATVRAVVHPTMVTIFVAALFWLIFVVIAVLRFREYRRRFPRERRTVS